MYTKFLVKLNAFPDKEACRSIAELYVAELCFHIKQAFNLLECLLEF